MIIETTSEDYTSLLVGRAPRAFKLTDTPIAPAEVLQMLANVATQIREGFAPASWLIIHDGELVGLCTITRPPENGVIDIGYGIAPSRRNQGIASQAVGDIVAWARSTPMVNAITAETSVENLPSQQVLIRNGFSQYGERLDDEDGPLFCWRCSTD